MKEAPLITELVAANGAAAIPMHKHNVYQMIYVASGRLSCEIAGISYEAVAPALLFIGNWEPHWMKPVENTRRYLLTLDPDRFRERISPRELESVFSYHPDGFSHCLELGGMEREFQWLFESFLREWEDPEEALPQGAELLFAAMLYRLRQYSPRHFAARSFGNSELTVLRVRRELEERFGEKLDLNDLARRHHISRFYLAHLFREVTGYSLKEYQGMCRIAFACRRLSEGDAPVGRIAEEAGFPDFSNFSRAFKRTVGVSPSNYRALVTEKKEL